MRFWTQFVCALGRRPLPIAKTGDRLTAYFIEQFSNTIADHPHISATRVLDAAFVGAVRGIAESGLTDAGKGQWLTAAVTAYNQLTD